MNLYLDEDMARVRLAARLRQAGHRITLPSDARLIAASDPRQFRHAIANNLVLLTRNRADFAELHDLVLESGGAHSRILIVTLDNDPTRDITDRGIETALRKLERSGLGLGSQIVFLSYWR